MQREPVAALVGVRLLHFPLGLWEQSQEHVDELLREFTLITESEDEHPSIPGSCSI